MHRCRIRALQAGALFMFALSACLAQARASCNPTHIDATGQVEYIYDGDTVRLANGRRLRLIGLDAPEIAHNANPAQPFGKRATKALKSLLARHNEHVLIDYGAQRRDHYGRWLAHLYLADKTSVTAYLLRQGMATALVVPPNTSHLECYQRAEAQARAAHSGIWRLPRYRITATTGLNRRATGFHRIRGEVVHVGHGRYAIWLDLAGNVALRIKHEDTHNFPNLRFDSLKGKQVTARGWLYRRHGELRMPIRHPAAIEAIAP